MEDERELTLVCLPSGGFSLESGGDDPIRVVPDGEGWTTEGRLAGWRLRRGESDAGGLVLSRPGSETEAGRATPTEPRRDGPGTSYLLLEDGRLFRVAPRGMRDGRWELLGWETPGAYWVASPEDDRWTLRPTPAGGELSDTDALMILFAAELLRNDGELGPDPGPQRGDTET